MNHSDKIMELAIQNNGVITTAAIDKGGLSRGPLKYLSDKGRLKKTSRGVYVLPDVFEDDLLNIQTRFKRGIFSLETALYLYDLTDRTPHHYHMTFPEGYNLSSPKANGIYCHTVKKDFYCIGIEERRTPNGNNVYVYRRERTLCGILRPQKKRISNLFRKPLNAMCNRKTGTSLFFQSMTAFSR